MYSANRSRLRNALNQFTQPPKEFRTMLLDLNALITTPDGKPIEPPQTLAKTLSGFLSQDSKGDAMKCWEWSKKLAKDGVLELDSSDTETLKGLIRDNDRMAILVKGPLLIAIKESETAK